MDTFLFLDKVGKLKQKSFYAQGIFTWQDYLVSIGIRGVSKKTKLVHDLQIKRMQKAIEDKDFSYMVAKFPKSEQYRLYNYFPQKTLFLDIESSQYYGDVAIIGMYSEFLEEPIVMVQGSNMDRDLFINILDKHDIIVTFNGRSYDIPVLKRFFRIEIDKVHIDVRFLCQKVGLIAGLKVIEKILNIQRRYHCPDPVLYWSLWQQTRDEQILEDLIGYNKEDVMNLIPILDHCIKELNIYKRVESNNYERICVVPNVQS